MPLALSFLALPPGTAFSQQNELSTEQTVQKAVELLATALKCPIKNVVDGNTTRHSVFSSIGDEFELGIRLKIIDKTVDPDIDVSQLQAWDTIGEEQPSTYQFAANWAELSSVESDATSITLNCRNGDKCISYYEYLEYGYPIAPDGTPKYGNISVNFDDNRTLVESRSKLSDIKGLCPDQVSNVVLAIKILMQAASTGITTRPSAGAYEFKAAPPVQALIIRKLPGKQESPAGAIPMTSGPLFPTDCKKVSGYKFEWCKIKWAGVEGWVSKTMLVPRADVP
ncbi:hypothetical protein NKH36_00080 [Mesorhizobium sp. M1312]|uniref:hypothetical protein n=1 Tax=unclassified Mesorhizobium TaxID=325217 RepID=UPI0033374129